MGKKAGCALRIIDAPLPAGDQADDEYWRQLWHTCVREEMGRNLPDRGPLRVDRASLQLPAGLHGTVVQAPAWTPVYGWIVPADGRWQIVIRTESSRAAGDFPQIAALMQRLAGQV
jgi:hypothetical protein